MRFAYPLADLRSDAQTKSAVERSIGRAPDLHPRCDPHTRARALVGARASHSRRVRDEVRAMLGSKIRVRSDRAISRSLPIEGADSGKSSFVSDRLVERSSDHEVTGSRASTVCSLSPRTFAQDRLLLGIEARSEPSLTVSQGCSASAIPGQRVQRCRTPRATCTSGALDPSRSEAAPAAPRSTHDVSRRSRSIRRSVCRSRFPSRVTPEASRVRRASLRNRSSDCR